MANRNHHQSQWTPPGAAPTPRASGGPDAGPAQQWQGQSGQYYDPSQTYYDPNHPQAWQQAATSGMGSHPKPPYRRWWFWAIIIVVLAGLVAILLALRPGPGDGVSRDVPSTTPLDSDADRELPEIAPTDPDVSGMDFGLQRDEDAFVLTDGGTREEALAVMQDRIDAGYFHYGPGDLVYHLRSEGYQNDAIEHALNNLEVDWDAQALGVAQRMADNEFGGYSASQLSDNLAYSGFSGDEIHYALDGVDIDYNIQALQELESYRGVFEDEPDVEARQYLEHAGFEASEIDYAFDNID